MSRRGNPYDNAHVESFFKTLKHEEIFANDYSTIDDLANRLPHFLEEVYNRRRLHSPSTGRLRNSRVCMQPETLNRSIQPTPTVHPRGFTPTCVQYWKAANNLRQHPDPMHLRAGGSMATTDSSSTSGSQHREGDGTRTGAESRKFWIPTS